MNKKILSIAVLALLSGCVSVPNITQNKPAIIKNYVDTAPYALGTVSTVNRDNWWLDFNDEQLNNLLLKVKKTNSDLKVAKYNLEKAQSYYEVVQSNNYPTVNFESSFNREKLSQSGMTPPPYAGAVLNMGQVGLSSRYTLDYMNKNNLLSQEQKNKNVGLQYQIENIELSINIQVTKAYVYYQYLMKEENLLQERIQLQKQIEKSYEYGLSIGKVTENQINDVKNQGIVLNNNLNIINQNKQTTLNMLIQLAGNENIILEKSDKIWEMSQQNPYAKVDISLITQRPDIKYYLSNIQAQSNHLEALRADFYPSISLTGDIGFQKVGFSDLINKKSIFYNIGPEITLPIFDAGRIKNNYKIAGIDLNIFIENYNNAIYSSIQEVNNTLLKEKTSYQNLENQHVIFSNQEKNTTNNINLFKNGKISSIAKTQFEIELLNSKEQLLNNELNYMNAKLDVIQSLGGK